MGYRFNDWLIFPHYKIGQVIGFHGSNLYPKTHLQVFDTLAEGCLDSAVKADLLAWENQGCLINGGFEVVREGDGSYWTDEIFCPLGPVEAFDKSKGFNFFRKVMRAADQLLSIERHTPGSIAYSAAIRRHREVRRYERSGATLSSDDHRSRYHCERCGYSGLDSAACARCGKRTSISYAFD